MEAQDANSGVKGQTNMTTQINVCKQTNTHTDTQPVKYPANLSRAHTCLFTTYLDSMKSEDMSSHHVLSLSRQTQGSLSSGGFMSCIPSHTHQLVDLHLTVSLSTTPSALINKKTQILVG